MEIKSGDAPIETQTSSETDSESEISLERIAEKKKNNETQPSKTIMYLHYYTPILYDKPLSLKHNGALLQEKGKKQVLHDQDMHRRDLPVSHTRAYRAAVHDGAPIAVNSMTLPATEQSGVVPFFEQRASIVSDKVSDRADPATRFDASRAVDMQPSAESVPAVGPAHDTRGHYDTSRPPAKALHTQRNELMNTAFSTITKRERLNTLRLGDSHDDQTVRISYPFQRWFGDHSVKVTLRRDSLFESAMVLQPSDVRASDALARQLGHWPNQTPHILLPDNAGDEQQQGQQQKEQEEEQ
ncbi:SpaN/EivJ family type III secretion system needle length determinant [Symbiopectobacterium purcellii]|uniref:SpaN/EivJ family type III secretion system needle length determinant n=1 Tax=Symbiopectobacterium purcellii TaxID=2871826 RepID=UPI003F85B191